MILAVKLLDGLPPYGPPATSFPTDWGRLGREGTVVEFQTEAGTWIGNFRGGLSGIKLAALHPNQRDAIVISGGDLWVVDVVQRSAQHLLTQVKNILEVRDPDGWVFDWMGLALARLGPNGLLWHTRRLSWDGFDQLEVGDSEVTGLAYSAIGDGWRPLRVDLRTGRSTGGSYFERDDEKGERLAE